MRSLRAAPGLQVTLFASEPEVRQPVFAKCDPRGRLWVIQCLQYPNPAGLKRAKNPSCTGSTPLVRAVLAYAS
jgi:hypothetical protein